MTTDNRYLHLIRQDCRLLTRTKRATSSTKLYDLDD
jgi:hypothetical protein